MAHPFVDTDVLIRFLTGDDLAKQASAAALIRRVELGELTLAMPDTAIADAVFVLSSPRLYRLPRLQVARMLSALVRLPHLHVPRRRAVLRALSLYGSINVDFGDAMILASMEHDGSDILYSYDADFDRIPGITRREP